MADVFISYSRRDTDFVKVLHQALGRKQQRDLDRLAGHCPPPPNGGKKLKPVLKQRITLSSSSAPTPVGSKYCLLEIDHAIKHNKRVIPVLRRSADMPKAISHIQRVSFLEDDPFDARLCRTGRDHQHRPAPKAAPGCATT